MRPRISIRGSVRPLVRPSVGPSVCYAFSKIAKINEIRHKKRVHLYQKTTTTSPMKPQLQPPPLTRLPQLRVGGQGLYLRLLNHLGRSSEAKDRKNKKKHKKCDGWMDGPTDKAGS